MKDLKYYMDLPYKIEIVPDTEEGGFVISYPELPGCISQGDTLDEALVNIEDAKENWLMVALEEFPKKIPEPKLYSGQFRLRIPKILHKQLAEEAEQNGVSMNQYCTMILAAR